MGKKNTDWETEPTPEELAQRSNAGLSVLIGNIVKQERENWTKELEQELAEFSAPQREVAGKLADAADAVDNRAPQESRRPARGLRLSDPRDHLYARFTEEEQQWRTPDADHWNAEWIRGMTFRNYQQKLLASAKLEEIFGRGDTVEGDAVGTAGAVSSGLGGEFIPRPLENVILIARDRVAKMRRFANNFTMTRQTHQLPTAASMTAEMSGESTTSDQGEPTIAQVVLTAQKGQVKAIASKEMLADAAIALVNMYAQRAGMAIGELEDDQFWADGDGTPPNISSKVDGTAYSEETSGALAYIDVVQMYYAVPQVYRQNASWYAAADVLQFLSLVVDGGDGRPFYQGLQDSSVAVINDDNGQEGTLLRRPIYEVGAADGVIMFGDMRAAYTVGTRQGIEASSSEHFLFDSERIMWLWTQRFDGIDIDAVAVQRAAGITSATASTTPA